MFFFCLCNYDLWSELSHSKRENKKRDQYCESYKTCNKGTTGDTTFKTNLTVLVPVQKSESNGSSGNCSNGIGGGGGSSGSSIAVVVVVVTAVVVLFMVMIY
jgi:hypothetical protein